MKTPTQHPCAGMTKAQIAAFEAIAINLSPSCSKKTLEALLENGLIASEKKLTHFRDGLPPLVTPTYYVPLPIHYQWCQWASEQYRDL